VINVISDGLQLIVIAVGTHASQFEFLITKSLMINTCMNCNIPRIWQFCSAAGDSNAKELLALGGEAPDLLTRFLPAAISRTLALLNSAGTNFINYLLKVKVRTE